MEGCGRVTEVIDPSTEMAISLKIYESSTDFSQYAENDPCHAILRTMLLVVLNANYAVRGSVQR
jgi:hypothetical protein